jgi:hypothetical protein
LTIFCLKLFFCKKVDQMKLKKIHRTSQINHKILKIESDTISNVNFFMNVIFIQTSIVFFKTFYVLNNRVENVKFCKKNCFSKKSFFCKKKVEK